MEINTVPHPSISPPKISLIPQREVEDRFRRSRWWIRIRLKRGEFPKPVIMHGRVMFIESEIDEHIKNLVAQSRGTEEAVE